MSDGGRSVKHLWISTVRDSKDLVLKAKARQYLDEKPLRPATLKYIALGLGSFMDKDGVCHPSLDTLTERLAVGRQTVQIAVQTLVRAGFLSVEAGRGQRSTVYRATLPAVVEQYESRAAVRSENYNGSGDGGPAKRVAILSGSVAVLSGPPEDVRREENLGPGREGELGHALGEVTQGAAVFQFHGKEAGPAG